MAILINIGSLNDGEHSLQILSTSNELGLANGFIHNPVNIDLNLFKSVHQLDIKAKISGLLVLECDRCLEKFQQNFIADLELVYVQKSPRSDALNDDYIRTYNPNSRTIDITKDIKESIILSVPMKQLPLQNSDGSCSVCGKNSDYWKKFLVESSNDFDEI
jgi:uncharacterized metal-binding protein YceD (DUF177 family)